VVAPKKAKKSKKKSKKGKVTDWDKMVAASRANAKKTGKSKVLRTQKSAISQQARIVEPISPLVRVNKPVTEIPSS